MNKVVGVVFTPIPNVLAYLGSAGPTDHRLNVGGSAYRDSKGQTWSSDYGFNTGSHSHSAPIATITGSTDPTLFKSARVGVAAAPELQYQFTLVNGLYKVNLYFARPFIKRRGAGSLMFKCRERRYSADWISLLKQAPTIPW